MVLQRVADFLSETADPWWVLGSAAMALIGVDPGEIRDIDVLVSASDAEALMTTYSLPNEADGGTEGFRSTYFLKPDLGDVPVEVMGGYQIRTGGLWTPVEPLSRQRITIDNAKIYIPNRNEQIEILKQLGRPKDLARLKRFNM
jgi:hypothetical protein